MYSKEPGMMPIGLGCSWATARTALPASEQPRRGLIAREQGSVRLNSSRAEFRHDRRHQRARQSSASLGRHFKPVRPLLDGPFCRGGGHL